MRLGWRGEMNRAESKNRIHSIFAWVKQIYAIYIIHIYIHEMWVVGCAV